MKTGTGKRFLLPEEKDFFLTISPWQTPMALGEWETGLYNSLYRMQGVLKPPTEQTLHHAAKTTGGSQGRESDTTALSELTASVRT